MISNLKFNLLTFFIFFLGTIACIWFFDVYKNVSASQNKNCSIESITEFPIMNKKFYEDAYADSVSFKKVRGEVIGGLVNHHLLASSYIAEVLESLKKSSPKTIILISPNHFDHGQESVQTANLIYQTPLGEVKTDCKSLSKILENGIVQINNNSFKDEHGILNILPFIVRSIPDARIIPIIVRDNTSYGELDKLASILSKIPDSVILGSFDFSHELPSNVAEFKDQKSLNAIEYFDMERIKDISVDSIKGMYLTQKTLENKNAKNFNLFRNTNSGYLTNTDMNDATSYITGVYKSGAPDKPIVSTVLMFGDLMFDRLVAKRMSENGNNYPFANMSKLFMGSDIISANLEGTFTTNESISNNNPGILRFTFNPSLIPTLTKFNIGVLSQANNHTSDFGVEGLKQSKEFLDKEEVETFGDFFNQEDDIVVKAISGQKIAFIGFNEFSYKNYDKVFELIKNASVSYDKVIVMPHWGIEYERVSSPKQKELARKFIDLGADVVVGSHPHVVQEIEIYKGKPIVYSLGNFVFDQDFSKFTTEGLGLGIVFTPDKTDLYLIPFNINKSELQLKNVRDREEFLADRSSRSDSSISAQILKGKITLKNE